MRIKTRQTNIDMFSNQNFVEINRLFFLVYTNEGNNGKRFNAAKYYLPKGIIKIIMQKINGKNFHDQQMDSDIKQFEEIRKSTTRQGKDYTTV